MTDYVLALIPQYGLFVVFIVTTIACLGIPLPAAMLALASGGFAATGDLVLWQVIAVTLMSFIVGDQLAFLIARLGGPRLIHKLKTYKKMETLIGKGENLLERRGNTAIILSRTLISPAGPWVSYVCGATGFKWPNFSISASLGAACWTLAYVFMGYFFAGQLSQITDLISNFLGVIIASILLIISLVWLIRAWKRR